MKEVSGDNHQNFQVFVRIKPQQRRKTNEEELSIVQRTNNTIIVKDIDYKFSDKYIIHLSISREKHFAFNDIIAEDMNNIDTFQNAIEPSLKHVLEGYNVAILAYGITGSGKTHTVFGNTQNPADYGICTQSYLYLVQSLAEQSFNSNFSLGHPYQLQLSFLEIYNENVRDLLQENSKNLMLIEDARGVYVQELSYHTVSTINEFEQFVQEGLLKRALAPTTFNQTSSRSHAVLQIHVNFKNQQEFCPKLTIIDLAGSEKGNFDPQKKVEKTIQEGANINKSLLALGNCINILSGQSTLTEASSPLSKQMKSQFVPYRDSKLTRLLKDSLGGNSHTVLLACISQKSSSYEETINTLNYASRALQIKKNVSKNTKKEQLPDPVVLKRYLAVFQQLLGLPQVCVKCGNVQKQEPLQINCENPDLTSLTAQLSKRMTDFTQSRQENLSTVKQQLKDSIDNLFLQMPKSESNQSVTSSTFNFEDRSRCVERVCNDLQSNIEEFYEIQNSLQELDLLLREDNDQYRENKDIQDRLQQALKVNLNQKEILKEILLKIGDDQKPQIAEIELSMRQQQLEMLNLLQTNQEQLVSIHKLEAELQQRACEPNMVYRVRSQMASNDLGKLICENPFEQNRLNTQSEELFITKNQNQSERVLDEYGVAIKENTSRQQQSIQDSRISSQQKGSTSQLRYQSISGETPSKKFHTDKENLQTFQSAQGSSDAYYSIENIPERSRESQKQPFVTRIQLGSPTYKTATSQENSETQNKRYSSIVNAFSRSNLTSLNIMSNLQPKQLYVFSGLQLQNSPTHSKRSQVHKQGTSSGTNPLASSQESFFQNESLKKPHEGSPQIFNTSRTMAVKYSKGKPSSSNMLILD